MADTLIKIHKSATLYVLVLPSLRRAVQNLVHMFYLRRGDGVAHLLAFHCFDRMFQLIQLHPLFGK